MSAAGCPVLPEAAERERIDILLAQLPHGQKIPREEGDLAFDTAWEIRTFAMAVALHEAHQFEWDTFQHQLADSIRRWEDEAPGTPWRYYDHWLEALENVLTERELVGAGALDVRTEKVLTTPRDAEHQHAHRDPVAVASAAHHH